MKKGLIISLAPFLVALFMSILCSATWASDDYQYKETRELVALVNDAAELVRTKGEAAFTDFRLAGSRWRQDQTYIFVLDLEGNMLVHPDPAMEGKNELDLKDINGKPIIRGLIGAATTLPSKPEGWYHYQWPVPGGILPRWKSSYVRLVMAPSGKSYVVGSGMYNDRMERTFVVDVVKDAVGQIEKNGEAAFPLFHDPTGPFIAKDAYIFVFDTSGVDLVNPAFPNLEGRNLLDLKDTQGKQSDPGDARCGANEWFRLGRLYVAQARRERLDAEVCLCEQSEDGRPMGAGRLRRLPGRCSQSGCRLPRR